MLWLLYSPQLVLGFFNFYLGVRGLLEKGDGDGIVWEVAREGLKCVCCVQRCR